MLINKHLKPILLVGITLILASTTVWGQKHKGEIREGNRLFKSEKFEDSEVAYRRALDIQSGSLPATFNLGDALYRQEKFDEAERQFIAASSKNTSKEVQAQAYHNMGNSLLQAGKLDESIEAYKEALRRNPADMETKYNLAYAQNLKKQQQEQQNQDQNQDQDQDQNQDQDQDQDQNQQQQQQKQQQQQPQNQKISKEDAQRLLAALANDEKKTQEKVKKAKAKAKKVRTLKDW